MVFLIRSDDRTDAAILHAKRPDVHPFTTNPHAAITKDATRAVEINHRRPLLLFLVVFGLHEFRFGGAVRKCHVLQFAFAAGIANRTIQRMVAEQQLDHCLASLAHFIAISRDDHALGDDRRAGRLKLGHFLDLHHAHATSALQRKPRVVAKRGHFDAHVLAGLNQQRARGSGELLSVDSQSYIGHLGILYASTGCGCAAPAFSNGQGLPSR